MVIGYEALAVILLYVVPAVSGGVTPLEGHKGQNGANDTAVGVGKVTPVEALLPVQGRVESVPEDAQAGSGIIATGTAPIINNNVQRARRLALQQAYLNAVEQGAGVQISAMSTMVNFERATHVLLRQTQGYIRAYKVISDRVSLENPQEYEVILEAEVVRGGAYENDDRMALIAMLDMADHPTVLLFLRTIRERESDIPTMGLHETVEIRERGEPTTTIERRSSAGEVSSTDGGITPESDDIETAMAAEMRRLGYQVLTSADVVSDDETKNKVVDAKSGLTVAARELGKASGADIVILGSIRYTCNPVSLTIYGVRYSYAVHATTAAKAVLTSSGQVLDVAIDRITRNAKTAGEARHAALDETAQYVARQLGWKIPEVLATYPTTISVEVEGCKSAEIASLKLALESLPGIDTVTGGEWQRTQGDTGNALFAVHAAYDPVVAEDLCRDIEAQIQPYRVENTGRYSLRMHRN